MISKISVLFVEVLNFTKIELFASAFLKTCGSSKIFISSSMFVRFVFICICRLYIYIYLNMYVLYCTLHVYSFMLVK